MQRVTPFLVFVAIVGFSVVARSAEGPDRRISDEMGEQIAGTLAEIIKNSEETDEFRNAAMRSAVDVYDELGDAGRSLLLKGLLEVLKDDQSAVEVRQNALVAVGNIVRGPGAGYPSSPYSPYGQPSPSPGFGMSPGQRPSGGFGPGAVPGFGGPKSRTPAAKKQPSAAKKEPPAAKKDAPAVKKDAPPAKKDAPPAKKDAPPAKKED